MSLESVRRFFAEKAPDLREREERLRAELEKRN